jgi:tetratricopeptide (TPR) repeat protein
VSVKVLDPGYAPSYNIKGNALADLKRYDEALTAYDQAIRLDPGYAPTYNNMRDALTKLKRYDEVLAAFDRALTLDPNNDTAKVNKGNYWNRDR